MINELTGINGIPFYALGLPEKYVPFCTIYGIKYMLQFDGGKLEGDGILTCRHWDGEITKASGEELTLLESYLAKLGKEALGEAGRYPYVKATSVALLTMRPELVFEILPQDSLTLENGKEGRTVIEFVEDRPHITFLEKAYPEYNGTVYDTQLAIMNSYMRSFARL